MHVPLKDTFLVLILSCSSFSFFFTFESILRMGVISWLGISRSFHKLPMNDFLLWQLCYLICWILNIAWNSKISKSLVISHNVGIKVSYPCRSSYKIGRKKCSNRHVYGWHRIFTYILVHGKAGLINCCCYSYVKNVHWDVRIIDLKAF